MDPALIEYVKGVTAFVLPAAAGLTAYALWLRDRRRDRTGRDLEIDGLREENAQQRAEVDLRLAEFDERVDFVERRLVQEGERLRLPRPPQVHTPV